jgi:hypothetical protein
MPIIPELFGERNRQKGQGKFILVAEISRRQVLEILMAIRVWGVFNRSVSDRFDTALYPTSSRAPSQTHVSGGIFGNLAAIPSVL